MAGQASYAGGVLNILSGMRFVIMQNPPSILAGEHLSSLELFIETPLP